MAMFVTPSHDTDLPKIINELYARGFATVAALSSVQARVETPALRCLIANYLEFGANQISRLESVAAINGFSIVTQHDTHTLRDLQQFARELARGLLSHQLELAAVNALLRLATTKRDLYRHGAARTSESQQTSLVFAVGEAEETAMIDGLMAHRVTLFEAYSHPRLAE